MARRLPWLGASLFPPVAQQSNMLGTKKERRSYRRSEKELSRVLWLGEYVVHAPGSHTEMAAESKDGINSSLA
jgi:hypothetical protein